MVLFVVVAGCECRSCVDGVDGIAAPLLVWVERVADFPSFDESCAVEQFVVFVVVCVVDVVLFEDDESELG